MEDFEIDIDLWVYQSNRELIGRFNASVLTDSTIMAIMDDIEKHLIDKGLLIPDKYQSIGSDNADYFVQEESI
jgi:hypothetical protein